MRTGKVNKAWHDRHRMPQNPSRAERVRWHAEHADACGCRPVPPSLEEEVRALTKGRGARAN